VRYDDLWDGEHRGIVVGERKVLLVRIDGVVKAYEDRCTHLGIPLSEGKLSGCVLECRAHGYQYDVCTGKGVNPARAKLIEFPVAIVDGEIVVTV
jgi:toluene monooxygenase system ferredoxin subunit